MEGSNARTRRKASAGEHDAGHLGGAATRRRVAAPARYATGFEALGSASTCDGISPHARRSTVDNS